MKLKQLGSNMTELHFNNGTIVLMSYETPVAAILNQSSLFGNCIETDKKWSRTTSKHITKWINIQTSSRNLFKKVDQSVLDSLVNSADNNVNSTERV